MSQGERRTMKDRDLILLLISLCCDRPEFGRTSLQKVCYFASLKLNSEMGYRAHYYGPFSDTVEIERDVLVLSGLVEESANALGFAGTAGFEAKQFDYRITETGAERIRDIESHYQDETRTVKELVEGIIAHAGGLEQRLLSAAAKTLFVAREQQRPVTVEDVRVAAEDFGWSLTEGQISSVLNLLQSLEFIEIIEQTSS